MAGIVLGDTLDSFRQKRFLTAERRAKGSELAAVSAVLLTTLPPRVARCALASYLHRKSLAGGSPKAGEPDLAQLFVQVGRGVRIRFAPAVSLMRT